MRRIALPWLARRTRQVPLGRHIHENDLRFNEYKEKKREPRRVTARTRRMHSFSPVHISALSSLPCRGHLPCSLSESAGSHDRPAGPYPEVCVRA